MMILKYCWKCEKKFEFPINYRFCPFCGAELQLAEDEI